MEDVLDWPRVCQRAVLRSKGVLGRSSLSMDEGEDSMVVPRHCAVDAERGEYAVSRWMDAEEVTKSVYMGIKWLI